MSTGLQYAWALGAESVGLNSSGVSYSIETLSTIEVGSCAALIGPRVQGF